MISKAEAAKRGLIKHPSGFYIDKARFDALPGTDEWHKIRPARGEISIAESNKIGWFVGFATDTVSNTLSSVASSNHHYSCACESSLTGRIYLNGTAVGFIDSAHPLKSDIIPLSVLVSPARLALERQRQRLDSILK